MDCPFMWRQGICASSLTSEQAGTPWKNALRLGIRPEQADFAVGSHGHYDHAAGYRDFVAAGLSCPLVTGNGFLKKSMQETA